VLDRGDGVIALAITHLDTVGVFAVDALYGCGRGFEDERSRDSHRHIHQSGVRRRLDESVHAALTFAACSIMVS